MPSSSSHDAILHISHLADKNPDDHEIVSKTDTENYHLGLLHLFTPSFVSTVQYSQTSRTDFPEIEGEKINK